MANDVVKFVPDDGSGERNVPRAEVFRLAKCENSHSEKQAKKALIKERKDALQARRAAVAADKAAAAAAIDTRTECKFCGTKVVDERGGLKHHHKTNNLIPGMTIWAVTAAPVVATPRR